MDQLRQIQLTDWSLNPEIMQVLQLTLHPPHALHNKKMVSSPTFPFCFYGSEGRLGQEHYCNAFQTTFNEYGLCYTFNNAHQGTVFENHIKSLIQHCERSELRLHYEWTKVHLKCQ